MGSDEMWKFFFWCLFLAGAITGLIVVSIFALLMWWWVL